jgi:hypothetical protein
MRPRLSTQECRYIAELLRATQPLIEEKLRRLEELRNKINLIRVEVFQECNPHALIRENFKEKKLELEEKLEREADDLSRSVNLHTALANKYMALVTGKGKGRHKSNTHVYLYPERCVVP